MLTANTVAYRIKSISICTGIIIFRHTSVARWTSPSCIPSQSAIAWFIEENSSTYCFPCSQQIPRIWFVHTCHHIQVSSLVSSAISWNPPFLLPKVCWEHGKAWSRFCLILIIVGIWGDATSSLVLICHWVTLIEGRPKAWWAISATAMPPSLWNRNNCWNSCSWKLFRW